MRKSIAILVLVSMAIGSFVAGCGSDDSADAEQIDKATFVAQANEICQQVSGKMAGEVTSIVSREQSNPNYDFKKTQLIMVKEALIPGLEEELQKIRALGTPSGGKKDAEAFLRALLRTVETAKEKPRQMAYGYNPFGVVEVAGTKFGISECPIAPVNAN